MIESYRNKLLKANTAWICKNVSIEELSGLLEFVTRQPYTPAPMSVSSFYGIWMYENFDKI